MEIKFHVQKIRIKRENRRKQRVNVGEGEN